VIEVQHEALADYLRAKSVASTNTANLIQALATMPMPEYSFFPVLLISLLKTRQLQKALWSRLSRTSMQIYLDALRYRFDISSEIGHLTPAQISHDYLQDLVDGIMDPLSGFFPEMQEAVIRDLIGGAGTTIAITGMVYADSGWLTYELHALQEAQITVGSPPRVGTMRGVNLNLSRYRLDSGRLIGLTLLRDTLLKLIKMQNLIGGPAWVSERLIGRIRFMAEEFEFPGKHIDTLDELDALLRPYAGQWVGTSKAFGDENFSVQSVLDDITTLKADLVMTKTQLSKRMAF
jgi:hypothetical protein